MQSNEKPTKKEVAENSVKEIIKEYIGEHKFYQSNGEELTIRIGDAEKVEKPISVKLAGEIKSPAIFWNKRKHLYNPDNCHVLYDRNRGVIQLVINENAAINYQVNGNIEINPDLKQMNINSTKIYGCKELMEHLKFNRVLFVDREENNKIVTALQLFKVKINNEKEISDTNRGTQKNVNNFQLEHSFQESFYLSMPIFKGGENKKFKVDICLTVSDGDVVYWLESRELKELESADKWQLLENEIKHFNELVVIEQ